MFHMIGFSSAAAPAMSYAIGRTTPRPKYRTNDPWPDAETTTVLPLKAVGSIFPAMRSAAAIVWMEFGSTQ
ncbi:hypothetical protein [Novosphingobium capsulatum]|uniref:hypothetical protein n=1 Tax=Novosphingobium capsulatum TaxID=13688 RepID=UPI002E112AD3|nr:hypothetical protein U0041_14480 [Novosphingobium capsulatum]